jgi:hypothetical protein
MSHWIAEAVKQGLEELDVDEALQQAAKHVQIKGEWERGVVSPSLVAVECRLQRLKRFLGHHPHPGAKRRFMATRAGVVNAVSVINMTRGFLAEGLLVAALRTSLKDRILATAPAFNPSFVADNGMKFAGHPDMMLVGDYDATELIQFKSPSVFKLDRVENAIHKGEAFVTAELRSYLPQLATELFICRNSVAVRQWGRIPNVNNLVLFSWEHTVKNTKPRVIVIPIEWDESLASIPLTVADELEQDAIAAKTMGIWPEALPEHQYDVFPCSYCPFSRLGDYTNPDDVLPKCDDHEAWAA